MWTSVSSLGILLLAMMSCLEYVEARSSGHNTTSNTQALAPECAKIQFNRAHVHKLQIHLLKKCHGVNCSRRSIREHVSTSTTLVHAGNDLVTPSASWNYKITTNRHRFPRVIRSALCHSHAKTLSKMCPYPKQIFRREKVLYRLKCSDSVDRWEKDTITVAYACSCYPQYCQGDGSKNCTPVVSSL